MHYKMEFYNNFILVTDMERPSNKYEYDYRESLKYSLYGKQGNLLLDKYDKITVYDNYIVALKDHKNYYFKLDAKTKLFDKEYEEVTYCDDNLWRVKDGKYGYVDNEGHEIIKTGYTYLYHFVKGTYKKCNSRHDSLATLKDYQLALYKNHGTYGLIDRCGKEIRLDIDTPLFLSEFGLGYTKNIIDGNNCRFDVYDIYGKKLHHILELLLG